MSRDRITWACLVASSALSATNIFDLPTPVEVALRVIGLAIIAALLITAWRWYRGRDLKPAR